MEVYHQMRGMIYQAMANILAGRGDDPEPFFRKALEDFTAGLDPPGTYAREFNIAVSYFSRCDTRTAMADHDERLGRDPGPNLKQALQDLLRGLLTYLELTFNVPKLERVLGRWCRHLSRQGRSPAAYCETWLDRLEKKASAHGAPPRAAMERALLLGCLGRYEETLALVASMEEPPVTWRRYARLLRRRLEALPAAPWKRSLLRARFWQGLGDFRAALDRCLAALGTVREPDPSDPDERADLAGLHVMTARMLARAAAGRTTLADEPAPVDPDTAEERKEKAVKHLDRAAALGRNRPGAWLADPDLAPLRDLPSFRSLVGR